MSVLPHVSLSVVCRWGLLHLWFKLPSCRPQSLPPLFPVLRAGRRPMLDLGTLLEQSEKISLYIYTYIFLCFNSPLSQLMASFGMKTTPTINHTTTSSITNKQPVILPFCMPCHAPLIPLICSTQVTLPSHPVTRNQTKILQEQLEKERIANLQKVHYWKQNVNVANF